MHIYEYLIVCWHVGVCVCVNICPNSYLTDPFIGDLHRQRLMILAFNLKVAPFTTYKGMTRKCLPLQLKEVISYPSYEYSLAPITISYYLHPIIYKVYSCLMHLHIGIPTFYPFDSSTGVKGAKKCVFTIHYHLNQAFLIQGSLIVQCGKPSQYHTHKLVSKAHRTLSNNAFQC